MEIIRKIFTFLCVVVAITMTIIWIHKYYLNDDFIEIDYRKYSDSKDVKKPMLSLCFWKPVIEKKLKAYDKNFTLNDYYDFLKGRKYTKGMENVDFNNVSINLNHFLKQTGVLSEHREPVIYESPDFEDGFLDITYSGFKYDNLIKCYGLKVDDNTVRLAWFKFDLEMFPNGVQPGIQSDGCLMTVVHMPDELLLAPDTWTSCLPKRKSRKTYSLGFGLSNIEMLKRRNKRALPCFDDAIQYDKKVFEDHVKRFGCMPRYFNIAGNYELCSFENHSRLESKAVFDMRSNLAFGFLKKKEREEKPCSTLENVNARLSKRNVRLLEQIEGSLVVGILYSRTFKEIKQVKRLNIETLIGMIGTYIGLFTGTFCCNILLSDIHF